MTLGVIDVGSNSVKLLVARGQKGRLRTLAHRLAITRLGAGLSRDGKITLEAADRTLETLAEFRELCEKLRCDRIVALGTEALRRAKNAHEFVERCEYEAGLRLRVIPGEEEARLSFLGATADWPGRTLAAIEIGGGSTQVTVGRDGRAKFRASVPIGAVNLTEKHPRSDPPTVKDRAAALRRVQRIVPGLVERIVIDDGCVVGIGGTAATLGAILAARRGRARVHGLAASRDEAHALYDELVTMKLARRREVPGLEPERADIVPAGLLILVEMMEGLGARELRVSRHGLRRGAILDQLRG